ncbi:MAG: helix-turn-helix domain-containing protein [Candidatus Doudnabacteria bacterium]|nr:helix-turn-helix domain-containing protein [Candidatus Doudnabacteria bacterium]
MTKLSKRPIDPKHMGNYINNLWSVFILLDTKDQIRAVFRDLYTHTEHKMLAKRLEIARRLLEGQTYDEISDNLKVTPHTIAAISNTLERDGSGLRIAHQRLLALEKTLLKNRTNYQKYLERRRTPKYKGDLGFIKLMGAGIGKTAELLQRQTRRKSAKKHLSVKL